METEVMSKEDSSGHGVFNMGSPEPQKPQKDIEGALADIRERFQKSRETWKERIVEMARSINDITTVASLQVKLYSYRQICLEEKHMLLTFMARLDKEYKKYNGKKWEALTNDNNKRLKMGEISTLAEADLATEKERIVLFGDQVDYLTETIRTMDHIIYGVRSRLELEQYKREQ